MSVSAPKRLGAVARLGYSLKPSRSLDRDTRHVVSPRCTGHHSIPQYESPQIRGLPQKPERFLNGHGSPAPHVWREPPHTACLPPTQQRRLPRSPRNTREHAATWRIRYHDYLHTICRLERETNRLPRIALATQARTAQRRTQSISAARSRDRNCSTAFV